MTKDDKKVREVDLVAQRFFRETLQRYRLPDRLRSEIVLGTRQDDDELIFEMYLPGHTPVEALTVASVAVNRHTGAPSVRYVNLDRKEGVGRRAVEPDSAQLLQDEQVESHQSCSLEADFLCHSCGGRAQLPDNIVRFRWGEVPRSYKRADPVVWARNRGGFVLPPGQVIQRSEGATASNFGDSSFRDVYVFDLSPPRGLYCPCCGAEMEAVAAHAVDGVWRQAIAYLPGGVERTFGAPFGTFSSVVRVGDQWQLRNDAVDAVRSEQWPKGAVEHGDAYYVIRGTVRLSTLLAKLGREDLAMLLGPYLWASRADQAAGLRRHEQTARVKKLFLARVTRLALDSREAAALFEEITLRESVFDRWWTIETFDGIDAWAADVLTELRERAGIPEYLGPANP